MIPISGVKVSEMFASVAQRQSSHFCSRRGHRVDELNLRRLKIWHGKVTRQINAIRIVANIHGKRLDEVFTAIAIVERAGAEKQSDWRIDRRLSSAIPRDADASTAQQQGVFARRRKFETADCHRPFPWKINYRFMSGERAFVRLQSVEIGDQIRAGARDELEHVRFGRCSGIPRPKGAGEFRGAVVEMVNV